MTNSDFPRREFLKTLAACPSILPFTTGCGTSHREQTMPPPPAKQTNLQDSLFVLDTWFWKNNLRIPQQNELLRELDIPRTTDCRANWESFPETLGRLDRDGIELIAVYSPFSIDDETLPGHLKDLTRQLAGRKTFLWVSLNSRKIRPSDPAGDEIGVHLTKQTAEMAQEQGLRISLYPHVGCWVERTGHAFEIAEKAGLQNVGCTFNLYHWLKTEGPNDLTKKAESIFPRLDCLTINGSPQDISSLPVEEGILPLGEGDYDVRSFVETFHKMGFRGPIGLQGYGIGGDIHAKLAASLEEWKKYSRWIEG